MKILFFSVKGGQGKTTHAISYAKHRGCLYLTNDYESGTIELYEDIFAENQLQILDKENDISDLDNIPKELDVVFDFGGWVDSRIEKITSICDVVVIPLYYQSQADLLPCLKVVQSLKKINKDIVILINNTEKKEIEDIEKGLRTEFSDLKVFVFNKSKFIHKLANEGKTLDRLYSESGLNRYLLKDLIKQKETFYKYLDKF